MVTHPVPRLPLLSICGINPAFAGLSPSTGYVPMFYSPVRHSPPSVSTCAAVRLACVRHAASVQSEPGSNSSSLNSFAALEAALTQSLTFSTSTSRELLSFMQSYATKHRTASCLKRPHSSAVTFQRTSVPPLLYSSTVLSHSFNGKRILSHCPIFCQDLV